MYKKYEDKTMLLHPFEVSSWLSLLPASVEEAQELIPSLLRYKRDHEEELKNVLDQVLLVTME